MISAEKARLRVALLAQLQNFTDPERARQNQILARKFLTLPEFASAKTIAFFASEPFEVATDFLIARSLEMQKRVGLPRVKKKSPPAPLSQSGENNLVFHQVQNLHELEVGCFGINCPMISAPKIPLSEIDLLVVPALAFDRAGNRLGRGGGFFDRVLAKFTGVSVGLAFDFQMLEKIPTEDFDQKVTKILVGKSYF
ncbi:MAG: 5-formyltetrahydrofolate cyclo-ligase [Patescibacteria group bacterium]